METQEIKLTQEPTSVNLQKVEPARTGVIELSDQELELVAGGLLGIDATHNV